jgi:hypothetical protein
MLLRKLLLSLLSAALLLAGCTGVSTPSSTDPSAAQLLGGGQEAYNARQKQAKDLIAERGKAILAKDEAAWLRPIEPSQTQALDAERMRYANLQLMRPVKFSIVVDSVEDFGQSAGNKFPPGATIHKTIAHAVVQFAADVDLNLQDYTYALLRVGTKLSIIDVKPADPTVRGYGDPTVNAPWDLVPLKGAQVGPVTILAPATSTWNPTDFTGVVQQANSLVRGLWGKRPAPTGFMIFLATSEEKQTWFSNQRDPILSAAAGFVYNPRLANENGSPRMPAVILGDEVPKESMAGSRIVIDMQMLKTPQEAYRVIAHEMAHAIGPNLMPQTAFLETSPSGILNSPTWAIEGFAEWVETLAAKNLADRTRFIKTNRLRFKSGDTVPPNQGFFSTDSARVTYNYQVSAMFFVAAERVGGRSKTVSLYERLATTPNFVADTPMFIDPVLAKMGIDPAKFWREFTLLTH